MQITSIVVLFYLNIKKEVNSHEPINEALPYNPPPTIFYPLTVQKTGTYSIVISIYSQQQEDAESKTLQRKDFGNHTPLQIFSFQEQQSGLVPAMEFLNL